MNSVVEHLYNEYRNEVETIREFLKASISTMECSTSIEDCLFLYLLIRYFKPKRILEIGTFVGSTLLSIVTACEKNQLDYHIYTIDLEDNLKVQLSEGQRKNITFLHSHSDTAVNMISEHLDFIFADADLTSITAKKLARFIDETTIFATHDFVPPCDKGITSLLNIFQESSLLENHIIVPHETVNWIYSLKSEDSYHDSFTKNYLKHNNVICKRCHIHDINCCMAIIVPKQYKDVFGYKDYFDISNLYIQNIEPPYYYENQDGCIILNTHLFNNTSIQPMNQIVSRCINGIPRFEGFLR